jgi:hypothetical protein
VRNVERLGGRPNSANAGGARHVQRQTLKAFGLSSRQVVNPRRLRLMRGGGLDKPYSGNTAIMTSKATTLNRRRLLLGAGATAAALAAATAQETPRQRVEHPRSRTQRGCGKSLRQALACPAQNACRAHRFLPRGAIMSTINPNRRSILSGIAAVSATAGAGAASAAVGAPLPETPQDRARRYWRHFPRRWTNWQRMRTVGT